MPLFDFHCRACGHDFEALVRKDTPICPACQGADLERQLSTFAVNSPERSRQVADAKVHKDSVTGARDRAALHREVDRHRKEDH